VKHDVHVELTTSFDGTRLALDVVGSGPPLVLVGGAFSFRRWKGFRKLAQLLADQHTVIAYDRRSRGDSNPSAPITVHAEIEDLRSVIARTGENRAHVFGMSSGGVLALRAAAAGVPIGSMSVYQPPFSVAGNPPPADFGSKLAQLINAGERSRAVHYFMTTGMGAPTPAVALMHLAPFWKDLKAVAHTLPADHAVMGNTLSGRSLPAEPWRQIDIPVLVIDGSKSAAPVGAAADELAAHIPNATRITLRGQGHNVSMNALAEVVADFAASVGGTHRTERGSKRHVIS
jgi:pimeloyl-ACP methyl ester carboxylesterase